MPANPVDPPSTVWTTVAQTLSAAVPLPLWRPAVTNESGYQVVEKLLSDKSVRQAWQTLDSTTVMASWGIIASRHLQTNDVVFGLLESGEDKEHYKVWPQLLSVQPEQSVCEYWDSVQRNCNRTLGIPKVLQQLSWHEDEQLLNTLIAVTKDAPSIQSSNRALDFWTNTMNCHRCSLLLVVVVTQEAPGLQLVFDQAVYSTAGIQQLGEQLAVVLGTLMVTQKNEWASDFGTRVCDILWENQLQPQAPFALAATTEQVLTNEPATVALPEKVLQWGSMTPDQLAIVADGCSVTYRELGQFVQRLASALQSQHKVKRETRMALLGHRSLASAVAVLATMLVGGTIVPIDSRLSKDRVADLLHDGNYQVLLISTAVQVPTEYQGAMVAVDDYCAIDSAQLASLVPAALAPQGLAYIIFLSGTMDRSRDGAVEHYSLATLVQSGTEACKLMEHNLSPVGLESTSATKPYSLLGLDAKTLEHLQCDTAHQLNTSVDEIMDILPMSSLQMGSLLETRNSPLASMVQRVFRIEGLLDVPRYRQCWQQVGQRHNTLRTKFVMTDVVPGQAAMQAVLPSMDVTWSYDESHDPSSTDFEHNFFATDRQHGFMFDGSPLLRLALFKINDTDHLVFLTHHHALLDDWSFNLVLDEVVALYHNQPLTPVVQYSSYLSHLTQQPTETTQRFWRELLYEATPTPDLQLPSTRPPLHPIKAEPYATHEHALQCPLSDIHAFCWSLGITTDSLLRGLWALLLHRYLDGPAEVTFGIRVSGRNVCLTGIDSVVGLCSNTVPFRAKFNSEQPLHNWLRNIHRVSGDIVAHDHASLVDIQQWLNQPADTPLFQSLLVYDEYRQNQLVASEHVIQMQSLGGPSFTKYPLTASFYDHKNKHCVTLAYKTNKYNGAYASLFCAYLDTCLARIIDSTFATPLSYVQKIPKSEHKVIMDWSHGMAKSLDPACALLPDLFTSSFDRCPDVIALENGHEQWTYAQVHQQAITIAEWLVAHHVQPGDRVALVFTRSPHFIFAVLAVLFVGGVYVPIDAAVPVERIHGILTDLDEPFVILQRYDETLAHYITSAAKDIGYCDTIASSSNSLTFDIASVRRHSQDLAYIIFTSGTTGKPKGVPNRHESIVNSVLSMCEMLRVTGLTRFAQLLNISFDGCVAEIFIAFYLGITLVLRSDDILDTLKRVDSSHVMPSLLSTLDVADYPNLCMIITCGEALPDALAQQWCDQCALFNFYGPSECAVGTHGMRVVGNECLTIGTAFPNLQTYILDDVRSLSPIGVPGEICIAGVGVSDGYLNRPDLTAKAFIDNPFGPGKLYLTGDLGCWLPNGKIKHLGRKDFQVKLRGFRIELGEVEQAILKHSSVTAACVIAQDGNLVAFVTPLTCDPQSITQQISHSLPPYMVPAAIVPLDALPLTRIGKVDRKALPRVDFDELHHQEIVPPQTPMEVVLVGMLAEVLGRNDDQISTSSTFFQLGGNSLTVIRLVAKCQQRGFALAMTDINGTHTIAQLAQRMESQHATADRRPYPIVSGPVRLTPIQREFLAEDYQWPQAYQSALMLQCSTVHAQSTWQNVVAQLLSYHDMLRFHLADDQDSTGASMGVIEPSLDTSRVLEFCQLDSEADIHAVALEAGAKVDHRAGPICQFRVVTLQQQQQFVLVMVHHLAFDLVSCIVLVDDVVSLLESRPLPPKTLSYIAWSDTLHAMAQDLDTSTIVLPTLSPPLPLDYPHVPHNRSKDYEAKEILTIDDELLHRFNAYTQQHRVTAVDLIMTALLLAFNQHLNMPSITVAFESNGRNPPGQSRDISRTLGWCVSHHYLSLTLQSNESPQTTLERTQLALRDLPTNGFNMFLAKHLKAFSNRNEQASFNINPELAFSYSDCTIVPSANDS
ncbi:hypothetical protein H4R35_002130, partial [Dimargaris xerosporica]